MKIFLLLLLVVSISSCGKIPVPSMLAPSENRSIQKVSFGEDPVNYQTILKNYLVNNLKNYKTAKVEFINVPSKSSIDHLGDNYSGYRVCLSINEKRGEHYVGYRNHFFLINNGKVNLHLFDSGLLTIPFEYCVSRNINNEYFVDDIPDKLEEINVESMDTIELTSKDNLKYKQIQTELERLKEENRELKKLDKNKLETKEKSIDLAKVEPAVKINNNVNIYILCVFDNKDMTYIFNASKETFKLINKLDVIPYTVKFNEAYIVASNELIELTINRVSGKAILQEKILEKGACKLTNETKI